MGSFAGTCAVSRLGISCGDPVFWIYSKKDYVKATHEVLNTNSNELRITTIEH